jgi:hypothetical protein
MKLTNEAKYLIDGYIDEVCVNLPKKKRADIAVEIRSLIMDALEDRLPADQPEIEEHTVLEALKEFGPPLEMASSYHAHNYVIGPQMYAPFWMTVRGTLLVMGFFYLLGLILSWGDATQSLASFIANLWDLIWQFVRNALQNLSIIFLLFIILERILPEQDWVAQLVVWGAISNIPFIRQMFGRTSAQAWDPQVLVTTQKSERVKRGETIFEIVVILVVAVIFNFFPQKVGPYGIVSDRGPWFVPLLAPTFGVYLPWWNFYWLLTLGLNFVLLARGWWNDTLRWAHLGLLVFSGALVYWMLKGPAIIGLTPEYLTINNTSAEAIQIAKETLIPTLMTIFRIVLILHLVVKVPTAVLKFFKQLGRPPIFTWKPTDSSTNKPSDSRKDSDHDV